MEIKENKMRKRILCLLVGAVIIAGIVVVSLFIWERNHGVESYDDLERYTEEILDIDWGDCIEASTGKVVPGLTEEEHAVIRFDVKQGCEQQVVDIIKEKCGEPRDTATAPPGIFSMYDLGKELDEKEIQFYFSCFREGKKAKSREFNIFVATDSTDKTYIYWFG
ncbi:MAG: hypothetical protein HDR00_05335 [Lachnospiraceae bacterium]|nr:hypothetical protein [Lachnospiraceae bacterium]